MRNSKGKGKRMWAMVSRLDEQLVAGLMDSVVEVRPLVSGGDKEQLVVESNQPSLGP
jgi:hypothetical protein